jgi:hypothetical protein
MVNYRKFEISDELFGGFSIQIDLDTVESLEDIVKYMIGKLSTALKTTNLVMLVDKLEEKYFHIHGFDFGHILLSDKSDTFYVCGHC